MILGLSGYARVGKDEAAKALVAHGWKRVAFADKLREFLYRMDPIVIPRNQEAFGPYNGAESLRIIIDRVGWDGYKQTPYGPHIREYLQRLGTECGRELIDDSIWIDAALGRKRGSVHTLLAEQHIVVTDVRFPNEAEAIRERGGIIVRIERPCIGPANDHPSERALDDWEWDFLVHNDGTVEELHHKIVALCDTIVT